jgi:hypothetical protein
VACAGFEGLDKSATIPLLLTFFANTINLEGVASGYVMVLASDLLLDFSDFLGEKLDRGAALRAHHVVMTAAVVLVLITGNAVVEGDFAGKSATGEELEGAVDGGEADAGIGFLDEAVQFVGRKMFARFQESSQNRVALFGLFQADAFEMLPKNSFGFADALRRDSRLIVDSFLQHVGRRRQLR